MLPTKDVLAILRDNLIRSGSVLPLSRSRSTGWAEGLGLPYGGRTVLYTGLIYQLMPSMLALEKVTSRFEESAWNRLTVLGRMANRAIGASRLASFLAKREDRARFEGILRQIVSLLRAAGEDFGYLYEEELYAGALAHDEGLCHAFERQSDRVSRLLKRAGVRRVITVDPHTTNVLRTLLPGSSRNGGPEVRSYLEVLAERGWNPQGGVEASAVIHDSCVYARHEGVIDEPRELLRNAHVEVIEPEHTRRETFCCGGPIESLFPGKARAIARRRVAQLAQMGDRIVTMCPICLVNLGGAARERGLLVEDISEVLAEGREPRIGRGRKGFGEEP